MNMNSPPIQPDELARKLAHIKEHVTSWLRKRCVVGKPFGVFQLCANAFSQDGELNASTGALELWVMLGLPLSDNERKSAIQVLKAYQNRDSGLVTDPSWKSRQLGADSREADRGDTFFTMTSSSALKALGSRFDYPIRYLSEMTPEALINKTRITTGAHNPFAIGDFGELVRLNVQLGVTDASRQWERLMSYLVDIQDTQTGLWPRGQTYPPYVPHINRSFHLMRTTWNGISYPYARADRMIDTCLSAADDPQFYDWTHGYACNDLDLAVMLYSASRWTTYRTEDVSAWARHRLPLVLEVQKDDGGFSFFHDAAMRDHAGIAMSPGHSESDTWGTLMYMGTIKMMVELGYDTVSVPWTYSQVHCVPRRP